MKHIKLALALGCILMLLTACGAMPFLPKPSITPIDIETTVADEVHVEEDEDNLAKLEVSSNHDKRVNADTVEMVENHIQEYPVWLVVAFAVAVGLAVPSPVSYFSGRRARKRHEEEIERLTDLLDASGGKHGESPHLGDWQSATSS